jgi:hypothetical protein
MTDVSRMMAGVIYSGRHVKGADIFVALCQSCNRDVVFIDGKLAKPTASEAPPAAPDLPTALQSEYAEAAAIFPASPRGSAALLRLAVQKLLPLLGATKRDINDQIGELVAAGTIPVRVQQALDALRVIGNEAVHPGTIDLNDDTSVALGLFKLLNFIVEKAITEPAHAEEIYAMIPQGKRDAIARRDGSA